MKVYDSQGRLKTIASGASVEPTSAQFSALSNQVSVADAALSAAINIVSNGLSNLTSIHDVLSNRVSANSAVTGSVTSNEVSAQAASAANIVSNNLSNEISNRVSADNVLSIAINVVSNAVSVVSVAAAAAETHASTASAAATSADAHANAASAAATSVLAGISAVSARTSTGGAASIHGLQSVVNALSTQISNEQSIRLVSVQTASAAATSADAHANTVSARVVSVSAELASLVQIASAAATSADAHANTASAAATSADTHANTASAAATSVDARVNSVNTFISGISALSLGGVSTHGLQSVVNALSNRISAVTGGSVTSNEVSAVSAQAASAINVVSARVVSVSAELASLVQIASAAATSADGHANTVSAALSADHFISLQNVDTVSLVYGMPVYAFTSANTMKRADVSAWNNPQTNVIGLVGDAVIAVSATGTVRIRGQMAFTSAQIRSVAGASALTPGNTYYLTSTGQFGFSEPSGNIGVAKVGVALDARTLLLQVGQTPADQALSNSISVVSARVVSVSAELASLVQVASAAATSADGHANTVSARVVSVSAELASLVQIASAAATSADAHANTASAAAASVDGRVNSVNVFISGISALSAGGVSTHGLQSVVNALSNRISAVVAGAASVTSTEASAISATAAANLSADHFISLQNVDTASLTFGQPVFAFTSANTMKRAALGVWSDRSVQVVGLVGDTVVAVSAIGRVQTRGKMTFTSEQISVATFGGSAFLTGFPYNLIGTGQIGFSYPTGNVGATKVGVALDSRTLLLQIGGLPADQNLSDKISVLSQQVSTISVNVASLQSTVSHLASAVSLVSTVSGAGTAVGLQSVINALSNRISAVAGGSVTSDEASAISAQAASAINVVSARLVSVSAELASLVQIASAAATSADGHANTVSARVVSVSAELGSLVQIASAAATSVNARLDAVSTVSGGGTAVGLQSVINALSNRISAIPGAGSVNAVARVSTDNVICAAALTDISGLTVSVSVGIVYRLEGMIMYSVSAGTGNAFGLTFPAMTKAGGRFFGETSVPLTGASTISSYIGGPFDEGDSGSAVWSAAVGATGTHMIQVDGVLVVATGGVVVPQARASVATNAVTIQAGSYLRVFKLS